MKKLLFQLDTDPIPNTFDTVVAYDAGVDHVTGLGGITISHAPRLVEGVVFTRPPAHKRDTALFITGSSMTEGEAVLAAITHQFFGKFRVSVMLDSNGANTTAAAAIAMLRRHVDVRGKRAVVLAGTGPVGQRAAAMLAIEGADVVVTSRQQARAAQVCDALGERFGARLTPAGADDDHSLSGALSGANIVLATGAAGVTMLRSVTWQTHPTLEVVMDANATPPPGIEGIDAADKAARKHGKLCFGALGFGGFKLELQRACVARLFETNDAVLDAGEVLALASKLLAVRQ